AQGGRLDASRGPPRGRRRQGPGALRGRPRATTRGRPDRGRERRQDGAIQGGEGSRGMSRRNLGQPWTCPRLGSAKHLKSKYETPGEREFSHPRVIERCWGTLDMSKVSKVAR